jgi:hypothetical protein
MRKIPGLHMHMCNPHPAFAYTCVTLIQPLLALPRTALLSLRYAHTHTHTYTHTFSHTHSSAFLAHDERRVVAGGRRQMQMLGCFRSNMGMG